MTDVVCDPATPNTGHYLVVRTKCQTVIPKVKAHITFSSNKTNQSAIKAVHTIGKLSVNASILDTNQEIQLYVIKPTCENFSSFRYFFYEKTVRMH